LKDVKQNHYSEKSSKNVIVRRIKSGGTGSQINNYNKNTSTTASKVSKKKQEAEDKQTNALEYIEIRNNAMTRLLTQGAAEILKHNFEEE
jgi:hypothetical protein